MKLNIITEEEAKKDLNKKVDKLDNYEWLNDLREFFTEEHYNTLIPLKIGEMLLDHNSSIFKEFSYHEKFLIEVLAWEKEQDYELCSILLHLSQGRIKAENKTTKVSWKWNKNTGLWEKIDKSMLEIVLYQMKIEMIDYLLNKIYSMRAQYSDHTGNYEMLNKILVNLTTNRSKNIKDRVLNLFLNFTYDENILNKFDSNNIELPVRDKILINLKTLNVRHRTPKDYFTKELPVKWNPDADKTFVNNLIDTIFLQDEESSEELKNIYSGLTNFFKLVLGYCITGLTDEQVMFFLHGETSAGKTLLSNFIKDVMGPFSGNLPSDTLVEHCKTKKHSNGTPQANPFYDNLRGKRSAFCSETDSNHILKGNEMKRLVGNERLDYRKLFDNNILTLVPQFKVFFLCNDLPKIITFDDAVSRRIIVIPFPAMFVENPDPKYPNQRKLFRFLEDNLKEENHREALLLYMIEGARDYLNLNTKLESVCPNSVNNAKLTWYNRDCSSIELFINACLDITNKKDDIMRTKDIYDLYIAWRKGANITYIRETYISDVRVFGRALTAHCNDHPDQSWRIKRSEKENKHFGIRKKANIPF